MLISKKEKLAFFLLPTEAACVISAAKSYNEPDFCFETTSSRETFTNPLLNKAINLRRAAHLYYVSLVRRLS